MGTRIWAHRGQAVTAVTAVLCWYCWEWQGALPSLLWSEEQTPEQPVIQTLMAAAPYMG